MRFMRVRSLLKVPPNPPPSAVTLRPVCSRSPCVATNGECRSTVDPLPTSSRNLPEYWRSSVASTTGMLPAMFIASAAPWPL